MNKTGYWHIAAAGAAAFWLTMGTRWLLGLKRLPVVEPGSPQRETNQFYDGRVAVIVPACNEDSTIARGMGSLLDHAPKDALVVAVNDRSTDDTGAMLDRLAERDPRLLVCHVSRLPRGWLGKTHALMLGTRLARLRWGRTGEDDWFLFTDADVVYRDGSIDAVLRYARENGLDHVTAFPHMDVRGFWETVFVSAFTLLFGIRYRIWDVNRPRSKAYVGIGAFNLVRASAYERMGTHRRLALDVADDVGLGREMRHSGARQGLINGYHIASVRWQHSLSGLITGLEKNGFAGVNYSLPYLVGYATPGMLLLASPYVGVFRTRGWARAANAASLATLALLYRGNEPQGGPPWPYFLTYPLGTLLFIVAIWRSTWHTLRRGGVCWRETFYPLRELKAGSVPLEPVLGDWAPGAGTASRALRVPDRESE